jgi:hypothetical protein
MKALIACFVLAIGLIGCSPTSSSPGIGVQPTKQDTPIQGSPFPNIIPTPIATKGTVVGKLVSSTAGSSLAGIALYFGTLLPLTPGPGHLINMDLANSPKAYIREDGRFIAENITPGEYVLILWTPHDSRYIPDPANTENEFIVEVVGGQIVDIGTLPAPSLP